MESLKGHELSWKLVQELDFYHASKRSGATYDAASKCFSLKSFGQDIFISVEKKKVFGQTALADNIINKTGHFFDLALLWYLISAQNVTPANQLVRPSDIKGGQIFVTGTHVLPLDIIAEKYGYDKLGFIDRGKVFDAQIVDHGDAAIRLHPFPKLPVTLILWLADDEFPAQVDFFFDVTCEQLPTDVLWATAMVSVLAIGETWASKDV